MNVLVWTGLALSVLTGAMSVIWLAAKILASHSPTSGSMAELVGACRYTLRMDLLSATVLAALLGLLVLDPAQRAWPLLSRLRSSLCPLSEPCRRNAGPRGDVHVVSDAVHLLSAGAWLGGLPAFVLLLWTARRRQKPGWHDFTITVTHRFSWLAAISVGTLLATGIVNSWNLLGGPRDLWTTDYGRLVAFKIVLLAAMIAIATVNKFHLTPRLPARCCLAQSAAQQSRRDRNRTLRAHSRRLPRAARAGSACPSGSNAHPARCRVHAHPRARGHGRRYDQSRSGRAFRVTIRVSREDFTTFAAKDVRLVARPASADPANPLDRAAEQQTDGTWTVNDIALPQPGIWTIRVLVIAQSGEPIVLDAPIVIERWSARMVVTGQW